MSFKERILHIYDKEYKKLLIIPNLLLLLAVIQIIAQVAITGDFVEKSVSLSGGSTISILKEADALELQGYLTKKFPTYDISVRSITDRGTTIGITIDSAAQTNEDILALITALTERLDIKRSDIAVEVTGSALGKSFFRQTFAAMGFAFLLMAIVVFLYFRTLVPSLAVLLAAFTDIVVTLAVFNLIGEKLTPAGIAAFLMLIGYSVDTDILLSTHVLRRKEGTILERTLGAVKTGATMTVTSLVAIAVGLFFTNSPVVRQIMLILFIGLLVDTISTWIQNAAIVRMYMEKKYGTQHHS